MDKASVSYETKRPVLLSHKHWISYLITRHMRRFGHCGTASDKTETLDIFRVHDLAKKITFRCGFCREMELKAETQVMAG